jgi:hypothetical protein
MIAAARLFDLSPFDVSFFDVSLFDVSSCGPLLLRG